MSAAAAVPLSRALPPPATTGDPIPATLKDWSPWSNAVIEYLPAIAKPADMRVYALIHRCTMGAKGRPEFCDWTQEQIAAHLKISVNTVASSLERLRTTYGVLRQQRVGRANRLGVVTSADLRPRLRALYEQHSRRTIEREEESAAEETLILEVPVPAAETLVILAGSSQARPLAEVAPQVQAELEAIDNTGNGQPNPPANCGNRSLSLPPSKLILLPGNKAPISLGAAIRQMEVRSELDERVAVHASEAGGVLILAVQHAAAKIGAVEADHLRVRLNRLLDVHLGPIDDAMLQQVGRELGGAPAALIEAKIRANHAMFTRRSGRSWGGVATLAKQVRAAWRKGRAAERVLDAEQQALQRPEPGYDAAADAAYYREMLAESPAAEMAPQWRDALGKLERGDASP